MAGPKGLEKAMNFPLIEAIHGRRARRFSLGSEIPDGPLAHKSAHPPLPLTDLEKMLVLTSAAGNTGWHYAITRNATYAPHLANYSGAAGGRTFPSAAGFHTSEVFFTDDEGVYLFETRDAPKLVEREPGDPVDIEQVIEAHRSRIRKLADGRLNIPPEEPYMEGHNTWCVNRPGSLLLIPVADIAQNDDRNPLLHHPERLFDDRRCQRGPRPGHGAVSRPGRHRRALPPVLPRAVRPHRSHRRANHLVLRRDADAPGDGTGRVDVRWDRPSHGARGERRPGGAWSRASATTPTSAGRSPTQPGQDGRLRRLLPPALPRHGRCGGGVRPEEVRSRWALPPRDARCLEGERPGAGCRRGPLRRVQGVCRSPGAVHPRPLSASSRGPCPACSASPICRRTTSTSSSTTSTSVLAPTCRPRRITWPTGISQGTT